MSESAESSSKRLYIVLAAIVGVALLGLFYIMFLTGGGEPTVTSPPPPVAAQSGTASSQGSFEDDGSQVSDEASGMAVAAEAPKQVKSQTAGGNPGRDPFDPLVDAEGTQDPSGNQTSDSSSSDSSDTSNKTIAKGTTDGNADTSSGGSSAKTELPKASNDKAGSSGKDAEPEAPQVIGAEGDEGAAEVSVHLLDLTEDLAIVRIDGVRVRLVRSLPGEQGVTYVAPLSAGCAWLGRDGVDVRVAICKGDTQKI